MGEASADIDTLRLALALADSGSLAKAAAGLNMSRRAATARLARLEDKVGATLFDGSAAAVNLTPAGDAFIAEARLALAALERAGRLARAAVDPAATIGIGATYDALPGPLGDLFGEPVWTEAGFVPKLHVLSAHEQGQALARGEIVLGFAPPPVPVLPRLISLLAQSSKWSAIVPDAEARLRKTASLGNLARKPLVVLERGQASLAIDGLIAALGATGTAPVIAQEAPDWPAVISMVALGLGSAIVPSVVAKRIAVQGATVLPLVEAEGLAPWTTMAFWLPQPAGSQAAAAIDLVRSRLR